jgi:hypothetical protein
MSLQSYLNSIGAALAKGDATEHTHRPALKAFAESCGNQIVATNEPKRIACGAYAELDKKIRSSIFTKHS